MIFQYHRLQCVLTKIYDKERKNIENTMLRTQQQVTLNGLCKDVLKLSEHITFVSIINERGRIEESQGRNSVIEKLPSIKKEMFLMENALIHRMRKEFDEDLGQVRFTCVDRVKRKLLSIPMEDKLLLVSFRGPIDSSLLTKKIIRMVHKYKKNLNNTQ